MKGLLLKDYYMLLKYCRPYALIVLIFGVCSLADGEDLQSHSDAYQRITALF